MALATMPISARRPSGTELRRLEVLGRVHRVTIDGVDIWRDGPSPSLRVVRLVPR